ncbi:serine carboxypeptidase-like 17 isoform X1 [Camellia sinensis]|uniref:serine carboxypeptidase-like 17 isoform X1 n=1 Tax=Camellia sinensis TaxID=4442 RepID=UPI001036D2DB|nr:serine carboxypeptidase-like 17 isoform X1 [Camellia sinensis]
MAHLLLIFMLSLLMIACSSKLVLGYSVVESLPGFEGPLPFELETGYVGVDKSEDVQLFYYFVKSESNPKEDPLVLWLTGGPGCSAFSGFAYEIGPLNFEANQKEGSLPTLVLNPNSWTKVASIIFVDLPVGTGFSYGMTSIASQSTDLQSCDQAYEFLRKWLIDHPDFLSNPVYMGGDSYTGITVPIIVQLISNGNEAGIKPLINLKGYLLGNPSTTPNDRNYAIPFAHGMGLISDELYESLQRSCQGEYLNIDPNNTWCLQDHQAYSQCIDGVETSQILEPSCGFASPKPQELFTERRYVDEKNIELVVHQPSPCDSSRINVYKLSYFWNNNDRVREALHIRKGSITEWIRCNKLSYTRTIGDSFPYHVNLSTKGYRSLIYSGDHDMIIPFLGTQAWIKALNYSIVDEWHSWWVQGQVAGYTRTYSNRMTFATVKGAGHTAPEYKPIECYTMFEKWISNQPL